ncbi:MAG: hypothetical protein ACLPPF_06815 [Rhodomicrobium sp.]
MHKKQLDIVQVMERRRKSPAEAKSGIALSERIHRELEQLELRLEEVETAEAEVEAAAETSPAMEGEAAPEEAPAKKTRRKLPEALLRRDIVG